MLAVLLNRVLLQLLRAVVQVRRDCREAWEVVRKPLRRILNAWARLPECNLCGRVRTACGRLVYETFVGCVKKVRC